MIIVDSGLVKRNQTRTATTDTYGALIAYQVLLEVLFIYYANHHCLPDVMSGAFISSIKLSLCLVGTP